MRSFLFLQDFCSPFFSRLADRLTAEKHTVLKINFNSGDVIYWGKRPSWSFRLPVSQLMTFLEDKFHATAITDIVLCGDCRPIHRPAIELCKRLDIRIHVFEEGYFRPYWVTLERDGVNAHSLLPKDPDWYRKTGRLLPDPPNVVPFQTKFRTRVLHSALYNLTCIVNPFLFKKYDTHTRCTAPILFAAGFLKRSTLLPGYEKGDNVTVNELIASRAFYYLVPLQLNNDTQIQVHSDFECMSDLLAHVMESFARHAPSHSRLVIKNHPFNMRLRNKFLIVKELEKQFDIAGRVDFLETGNLELLVQHAQGTVTVNSTVGGVSLQYNCPTITLSDPIYNMPGLTFQGSLDAFWQERHPPDPELFHCFKATVIKATQVNGGFYCDNSINLAVDNSVVRLVAERSPLEELLWI